jgi:hypothetical protein
LELHWKHRPLKNSKLRVVQEIDFEKPASEIVFKLSRAAGEQKRNQPFRGKRSESGSDDFPVSSEQQSPIHEAESESVEIITFNPGKVIEFKRARHCLFPSKIQSEKEEIINGAAHGRALGDETRVKIVHSRTDDGQFKGRFQRF